jgi:hypothetical protein
VNTAVSDRMTRRERRARVRVALAVILCIVVGLLVVAFLVPSNTASATTTTVTASDPTKYDAVCTDAVAAENDLGMNDGTRATGETLFQDGSQLYVDATDLATSDPLAQEASNVSKYLMAESRTPDPAGSASNVSKAEATLTTLLNLCHSEGWSG